MRDQKQQGRIFAAMAGLFLVFWLAGSQVGGGTDREAVSVEWGEYVENTLAPSLPANATADFPFGGADGKGAKRVRGFRQKELLGEQWKPIETKRRAPMEVRAIGSGVVLYAEDLLSEWGQVALVLHVFEGGGRRVAVETLYAHLGTLKVKAGDWVERGQVVGIWTHDLSFRSPGFYWEVRRIPGLLLGPGESEEAEGWTSPSAFVQSWRAEGSMP